MPVDKNKYETIKEQIGHHAKLIAVSKKQSTESIQELYNYGQRHFGENYVQEICKKKDALPGDSKWHFIGHLQTNKVKNLVSFIHSIDSVDSMRLLNEIEKKAASHSRIINVLLQIHIAKEESKYGIPPHQLHKVINQILEKEYHQVRLRGIMGMASFSSNQSTIRNEFKQLKHLFEQYKTVQSPFFKWDTLSMGMSQDYELALTEGSNMIRIGSLLFGSRV